MSWRSTATIRIAGVTKRDLSIPVSRTLQAVLGKLDRQGHKPLVVGGAVRDALLGEDPKDIDVEVHGTHYEDLTKTLSQHGRVSLVGKAFGVVKFTDPDGHDYDFSIPRRENKAGVGHRDFETTFDPDITPEEAAARRDFTFNALAYDPVNRELHDYFGGEQDLKDKVIRHTSGAFSEDPLRVLRGMQFAARYGMDVHPDTAELSKSIAHEYPTIPKERVGEEFMKLATKGREPGRAIDYLQKTGWHENFPEIRNLNGVPQDSVWHPEGDVAAHTAHAMNAAAKVADREGLEGDDRATVVFGAMAHDFGKPTHTQAGGDRITSFGHDAAGGPIARQFLEGIGIKPDITDKVVPLVENHMQHLNYEKNLSSRTVRRLAQRLHPASIKELAYVMESDHSGRPPLPGGIPSGAQRMLDKAEQSNVTEEPMEPFVKGRHVMPYFNDEPGPHVGEVTKAAYEAQLNGEINSDEEGQQWLRDRFGKTGGYDEPDYGGDCDASCRKVKMTIGELMPHVATGLIDDSRMRDMADYMDERGWDSEHDESNPIRLVPTGLWDGNHRVSAAHLLGWDDLEVPVHLHGIQSKEDFKYPVEHFRFGKTGRKRIVGMATIPHDQLPSELHGHIESFKQYPAVDQLRSPSGAYYNCDAATEDFYVHLKKRGVDSEIWTFKDRLPSGRTHIVNRVGDLFVDWTARQYHNERDFPDVFEDPKDRRFQRSVNWGEGRLPDPEDPRLKRGPLTPYTDYSQEFRTYQRELGESGKKPAWWKQEASSVLDPWVDHVSQEAAKAANLDAATIERLHQIGQEVGETYAGEAHKGGCHEAAEWIENEFGFPRESGAYIFNKRGPADLGYTFGDHSWNRLPDGSVLDVTHRQFRKSSDPVSVFPLGHPMQKKYHAYCEDPSCRWCTNEDFNPDHAAEVRDRTKTSRFEPGMSEEEATGFKEIRHYIYRGQDPQQLPHEKQQTCSETADKVADRFGWEQEFGEYWGPEVKPSPAKHPWNQSPVTWDAVQEYGISHMDGYGHWWNRKPDGTIVDASSDQFKKGEGVRVIPPGDPRQQHYWTEVTGAEHFECPDCDNDDQPHFAQMSWGPGHPYYDHFENQKEQKTASWRDVRNKGVRLRNSHKVNIVLLDDEVIAADVDGDHGTYHVVLYRQDPESWAISMWECSCKWGDWAFRRQHTYVGRMCSHALATLYEVHGTEYRRTAARDTALPDDVVKAFTATGEQQRGEPERIGQSLYSLGGGVLPFVAEHVGDLTHRMTHHVGYGTTYPNLVSEKVEKTLRPLTNPYGFERELNENLESNASYYGRNVDEMRSQQDEILRNYADAHRQLKVYNGPQWDARQAAILIGEKQWKRATLMLKHLRGLLEDPEEFHRQAMSFERNEDGSLREYEPEYEPEQPTRTAHIPEGWDWYYKGDDPDETKGFKEPHDTLYHVAPSGLREAIQQVGLEGSRTVYGEGLYAWDSPEGAEGWRKQVERFYKPDIHGHGEMDVWKVDAKDLPIHGDEAWPDVDPDEAPNPSSHFIPGKVGPERLTLHSKVGMAVPPEYWQDQGDLYHITDKQNVSGILHRGLVPHGGYSEWNPDEGDMAERLETRRNHLYFHTEPPTQYEKDSIWRAHVVVDPKMLDPQKVKADEDWAEHVHEKVRADPEFEESPFAHDPPPTEERWQESLEWHGTTPEGLGEWADRVGLGDNPEHTMRSVEETHTVAHEGPVPKGAIKGFYAKEPTGESESYKEELRWHPNEAYEGKDEMNHWAEGFPEASECPHGDECELRDVVPKVAAFVDHDPHDILDEKSLRKHLVRKHNDDPQFEGVIHLMEPDEMDELHSEDHSQFMGDNWGKDWDEDRDFLEGWHQPYKKKTAEDYVRDIEPASKREGDDFDYDTRWFHDKLNTDVLDTVKNLSDAYPVTKSWFKGIRVSDYGPVPCVVSNDKKIWLPPSYLDKPSANLPPRKGVNSLIAHEFGHVLQASVLKDSVGEHAIPDRDIHDLLTGNYSDDDLAHPDCPATYLMEHAKKKWPDERISGYAETNQRERFAEAMRKHWVEPRERLDKHSEFIGANIDFLYHRNGSGWKSRQEKTASSWFGKLMVDPHEVVASTSRGTLLIYATSGRTVKLSVEIASDSQSIRQGLMNRYVLPKDEGMVFLYPMPPSHSGFWMKNTLIPLSVAFWDQMGRIIEVKDMEPCVPGRDCPVYRCSKPYWGAVEVNKGLFRQYGVRPGDRIELRK